jgi:DNA-3-methyladenine glycosylase I
MTKRCSWADGDEMMSRYHDEEWGVPIRDSKALWAKLALDGFQAGLSWSIILKRRDGFYRAFEGFDPEKIAKFGPADVERLLQDEGIIRSRAKIEATIGNAKKYLEMQDAGEDFGVFCWSFTNGETILHPGGDIPAKTALSEEISAALKKRGFKFVGPVIVYAWMQAVGIVNDHTEECFRRNEVGA